MAGEKELVEGYLGTVNRLEPDIHPIDASAFYASAAISLRRIADVLEAKERRMGMLGGTAGGTAVPFSSARLTKSKGGMES